MNNIILASSSPRRREMLEWLGIEFEIVPSDFDENRVQCDEIEEQVEELALQKALVVAWNYPDSIILGADTLVSLDGEIIGKAENPSEAKQILKKLSGTTHQIATGVAILNGEQSDRLVFHDISQVIFRQLSDIEIDEYLQTAAWEDKAGAYAVQEDPGQFVVHVEGSYTNVMGLPLERVAEELIALGIEIPVEVIPTIEMNTGRRHR